MKKTMFALLPILILVFAFNGLSNDEKNGAAAPPIINAAAKSRMDLMLKSFIDSNKTMGLSALVFEKGKEVYFNAVGFADKEANRPMDRNTIVRIYSMTK